MARLLGRDVDMGEVVERVVARFAELFGHTAVEWQAVSPKHLALAPTEQPVQLITKRPEWMKVRAPSVDGRYFDVKKLIHGASLHTVCEEARCPNIAECWGRGTATFPDD